MSTWIQEGRSRYAGPPFAAFIFTPFRDFLDTASALSLSRLGLLLTEAVAPG